MRHSIDREIEAWSGWFGLLRAVEVLGPQVGAEEPGHSPHSVEAAVGN